MSMHFQMIAHFFFIPMFVHTFRNEPNQHNSSTVVPGGADDFYDAWEDLDLALDNQDFNPSETSIPENETMVLEEDVAVPDSIECNGKNVP
jgi:hypothetical protein